MSQANPNTLKLPAHTADYEFFLSHMWAHVSNLCHLYVKNICFWIVCVLEYMCLHRVSAAFSCTAWPAWYRSYSSYLRLTNWEFSRNVPYLKRSYAGPTIMGHLPQYGHTGKITRVITYGKAWETEWLLTSRRVLAYTTKRYKGDTKEIQKRYKRDTQEIQKRYKRDTKEIQKR